MSGGGGSSSDQVVRTNSDPWAGQQPYLLNAFSEANRLYGANRQAVPFSPQTNLSQQLTENRALGGSPLTQGANQLTQDTMGGKYLEGNPYIDKMAQQAGADAAGQINSTFSRFNRTGSPGHSEAMARGVASATIPLRAQQYDNERGRQMQASLFAPQLANQDYIDASMIGGIGAQKEAKAAEQRDMPYQNLGNYLGMIQGNYGGQSQQTTPMYTNRVAGGLGGALGGASIAGMLPGFSPWLGAGLGGIAGLLG